MIKKIIVALWCMFSIYMLMITLLSVLIETGITNSDSDVMVVYTWRNVHTPYNHKIYEYMRENPEHIESLIDTYRYFNWSWESENIFPKNMTNSSCFMFILNWIYNRKEFVNEIQIQSKLLWIDPDLVLSSVLPEQIRIACKWTRDSIKRTIIYWTPTLFRSYDVSLWLGGIKVSTAKKIKYDACNNIWWEICDDIITDNNLIKDDRFNAKYAVYLVYNILHRREAEWYDISNNPWVVATLYNMGNVDKKIPHKSPCIWWSIIYIWGKKYVYGGLWQGIYYHLKINHE